MLESYNRHDISDNLWTLIEPHTVGNSGTWGGNAKDTRQFINAVFWILRTGAPRHDLPFSYGDWKIQIVDFAAGVTRVCGKTFS